MFRTSSIIWIAALGLTLAIGQESSAQGRMSLRPQSRVGAFSPYASPIRVQNAPSRGTLYINGPYTTTAAPRQSTIVNMNNGTVSLPYNGNSAYPNYLPTNSFAYASGNFGYGNYFRSNLPYSNYGGFYSGMYPYYNSYSPLAGSAYSGMYPYYNSFNPYSYSGYNPAATGYGAAYPFYSYSNPYLQAISGY